MKTFATKTARLLALLMMFSGAASVAQAHGGGHGGGGMGRSSGMGSAPRMSNAARFSPVNRNIKTQSNLPTSTLKSNNLAGNLFGSGANKKLGTKGLLPTGTTNSPVAGKFPTGPNKGLGQTPTNPVGTVGGVGKFPTGPLKPIGPTSPTSPTNPVGTGGTGGIVGKFPTGPLKPIGPTSPTNPTGPTNPTNPTGPTSPTNPPMGGNGGGFGGGFFPFPIFGGFGGYGGGNGGGYGGGYTGTVNSDYAAAPAPVAASETPDLEVVAVEAVDAGSTADLIGPMYRVTVRNNGNVNIKSRFAVSLSASSQVQGDQGQSNAKKVDGLGAQETTQVDVRLPYGVQALMASAPLYLTATVDADQQVNDANRGNNVATVRQDATPALMAAAQ